MLGNVIHVIITEQSPFEVVIRESGNVHADKVKQALMDTMIRLEQVQSSQSTKKASRQDMCDYFLGSVVGSYHEVGQHEKSQPGTHGF